VTKTPAKYYCTTEDCGWFGDQFPPFSGRLGDLASGTVVPHGECPQCGNHVQEIPEQPLPTYTFECVRSECGKGRTEVTFQEMRLSANTGPECSECDWPMSRKMFYVEKIKHYAEQAAKDPEGS
jgi:predicted nucleic acid-binding Zn ribbon protein